MNLTEAAAALADVLAQENTGLAAFDFAGSARLAGAKDHAITAFNGARAVEGGDAVPLVLGLRLRELVAENKRLLEQALHVQSRVIACIARAAPRPHASARAYGSHGAWAGEGRALPIALTARV